ncbi:probable phycobilisome degradation protein [Crocosphaera subtropica ATCC 51142]|uniref:Probable phycobilisome degradation protein n=2 Tax=Crocosphaera TaxID=263510 RepID=B1WZ85_CROS5|nr:probable phycobilisome degradation protein [Crocosphaera subtropica ATCC 51142]
MEFIMDAKTFELSMEQQFQLQCLQQEFQDLEREQVIDYLIDTMQQIMARDNLIRDLMKNDLF